MEKGDILRGIYDDFFGINKLSKEDQKLAKEINELNKDFYKIENNSQDQKEKSRR